MFKIKKTRSNVSLFHGVHIPKFRVAKALIFLQKRLFIKPGIQEW